MKNALQVGKSTIHLELKNETCQETFTFGKVIQNIDGFIEKRCIQTRILRTEKSEYLVVKKTRTKKMSRKFLRKKNVEKNEKKTLITRNTV